MARHELSELHQLKGVRAALSKLRDAKARRLRGKPIWLIPSLERREVELELKLRKPVAPKRVFPFVGGR